MFNVTLAVEYCMICGVLSCVRPTRGIVALMIKPHRDNCFIFHFLQSLHIATLAAGLLTACNIEIGLCALLQCDMET